MKDIKPQRILDRIEVGLHECGRAQAALKQYCSEGHKFTPENTTVRRRNGREYRECKACRNARDRKKRST